MATPGSGIQKRRRKETRPRWGDCRRPGVGARRVSGRAVRGHFFYEEMVNVGCFFWAPGPNSNIRAGPEVCRGAHTTPGRSWAAAGIWNSAWTLFTRRRPWTPRLRMAAARAAFLPSSAVVAGSVCYRRLEGASGHLQPRMPLARPGCLLCL